MDMFPGFDVMAWEYGQSPIRSLQPPIVRLAPVYRRLGAAKPLFEELIAFYRFKRYGIRSFPSAQEIDSRLGARGIALLHFPMPQFFETRIPFIYEPWDLQFLHYPEFFSRDDLEHRTRMYRLGCQRAALIVTATRWVKDDIVARYGLSPGKIAVIRRSSLKVRQKLSDAEMDGRIAAHGLKPGFLFYPAMSFEHKNHIRLLRAFKRLVDEGQDVHLVLSGRRHKPFWPQVERTLAELDLQARVTVLGAVSDDDLTALFGRAKLMVFPSLFEGLGLPLLEAMESQLPIVASDSTCIPEVVGKAGILFDGQDEAAIAAALRNALARPEALAECVRHGGGQLETFNWKTAGKTLLACYKQLLGESMTEEEKDLYRTATS